MARDKDPYGPVRKTDPYVSGGAYGNGGEGDSNGSGGGKDESCGEQTAKMVVVGTAAILMLRALLRRKA